jgi:hypothetical protein
LKTFTALRSSALIPKENGSRRFTGCLSLSKRIWGSLPLAPDTALRSMCPHLRCGHTSLRLVFRYPLCGEHPRNAPRLVHAWSQPTPAKNASKLCVKRIDTCILTYINNLLYPCVNYIALLYASLLLWMPLKNGDCRYSYVYAGSSPFLHAVKPSSFIKTY